MKNILRMEAVPIKLLLAKQKPQSDIGIQVKKGTRKADSIIMVHAIIRRGWADG